MNNNNKEIEDITIQVKERLKHLNKYIKRGVIIIDPLTTYIADKVKIAKGTIIYPLTVIEEGVRIGRDCRVGPFARLREGTCLRDKVIIGNFVEVNRSTLSQGSKAKHLTYLGDTFTGEKVNIGAGTIVANYDGKNKNKTHIKREAFIGSGSILVAPVKVGKQAMTGAGSVVTKNHNVPDRAIVVGVPAKILKKKLNDKISTQYDRRKSRVSPRDAILNTHNAIRKKLNTHNAIRKKRDTKL